MSYDPAACDDCGHVIGRSGLCEWFMVWNPIWDSALLRGGPTRFLCVGCLETRLGRRLDHLDFTDAPVNHDDDRWPKSLRLRLRIGDVSLSHPLLR